MNIAYLTNMLSKPTDSGGNIHVMQVANHLIARGHRLYTNLDQESDKFIKFKSSEIEKIADEIDIFYIRIHGHHKNDELTKLRRCNPTAPCIWEINAPLEELLVTGCSSLDFQKFDTRRKEFAKEVDGAVCVSLEMEQYALEHLGIHLTTCIPNGSDANSFFDSSEKPSHDNLFRVIWVGSQKFLWQGFNLVERAAERLSTIDSDIKFVVTAEGTSTSNLQYTGHVPYNELPNLMTTADAGLCVYEDISFYKTFFFSPLKLYDYMASGLPVIGTNFGQIRKVVSETRNGILVDDLDQLVEAILYLKNNRSFSKSCGARSRLAAEIYYNWDRACSETEQFMNKVITVKRMRDEHLIHTQHIKAQPVTRPKSLFRRFLSDILD